MVSFVDALFSRYADPKYMECNSCELFIIGSLSPGKSGNNLILPPGLSLTRCKIRSSGSESKIREACKNVEELDLASNCLEDLSEVYRIIKCMPNLRFLNLSHNDFSRLHQDVSDKLQAKENRDPQSKAETSSAGEEDEEFVIRRRNSRNSDISPCALPSIRSLVLNNTRIQWKAVDHLLQSMPNLSELHLSLNNYACMDIPSKYPMITRLYISGNPSLCHFDEISNLVSAFPRLEGLTMADCSVSRIPENFEQHIPCLQSLNITNWPIGDWETLERLNLLPNLTELRCQGLKVLDTIDDDEEKRNHLIARLPKIKRLNGSEILNDERMFAERSFVRYHLTHDQVRRSDRFHALHAINGRVDPLAEVDLSPPKSAHVTVIFNGDCSHEDEEDVLNLISSSCDVPSSSDRMIVRGMTINLNKSVKDFKQTLSTMFGLPASKMRVFYVDHETAEVSGAEEMKFNQKKLFTYNIQDGDKFLVDPK